MRCLKCGAELSEDTIFCPYCGHKVEETVPSPESLENNEMFTNSYVEPVRTDKKEKHSRKALVDKVKEKGIESWKKLSIYGKIATVALLFFVILDLFAVLTGNTVTIVISVIQSVLIVISLLMHKKIIKLEQNKIWLKWIVLAVAILLTALNIMSYSWGIKKVAVDKSSITKNKTDANEIEQVDWSSIILSDVLPKPQSNKMEIFYNGKDWLSINVHDISEKDYQEYIYLCEEKYGFTVQNTSLDDYFFAFNQEKYCLTLIYNKGTEILDLNLEEPKENTAENSKTDKRSEKNGFDSLTNEEYKLGEYIIEIPEYWTSERKISNGIQRYAEKSGKVAMLQISIVEETDNNYPVTFEGLMDDNDNMIEMIESTAFSKVTDYDVVDTGVVKGVLYKGNVEEKESGVNGYGEWFVFASEKDRNWCSLTLIQTENTDYLYTADFMKILTSISPVEEVETESVIEAESSVPEQKITEQVDEKK